MNRKFVFTAVSRMTGRIQQYSMPLFTRLLVSFLIAILVPSLLVGIISYRMVDSTIDEEVSGSVKQTIRQAAKNIVSHMSKAAEISDSIYINPAVQRVMGAGSQISFMDYEESMKEIQYLTNNSSPYRVRLFYRETGQYPAVFGAMGLQSEAMLKRLSSYGNVRNAHKGMYWTTETIDRGTSNIGSEMTLIREIRSLITGDYLGMMTVSLSESAVWDIVKDVQIGDTGFVFLIDGAGKVISHYNKELLSQDLSAKLYIQRIINSPEGKFTESVRDENYLFVYQAMEATDWKIIGFVRTKELKSKINYIKVATISIGLFCFGLAILYSIYISGWFAKRVGNLIKAMKKMERGDFNIRLRTDKPVDEISELYKQFNIMSAEIKRLIEQIHTTNQRKRSAELKALQSQINPHFLYNTLDSINWMAASRYKANDISLMVTSLANLFRLSLNRSRDIISIKNEIEQVKSYIAIQKIRFDHLFDVIYEVDPAIEDCPVIKLILQPLVENSIIHGFANVDYQGRIAIRAWKSGPYLWFEVADNGVGCDIGKMNGALQADSSTDMEGGYGVRNVQERIKLYYGSAYGINFDHRGGEPGTIVRIMLPAYLPEEEAL